MVSTRLFGGTLFVGCLVALAACGGSGSNGGGSGGGGGVGAGGTTVGALCRSRTDCASLCVNSGDFPGMCSVACRNDLDCPAGTSCVDDSGGICAVSCRVAQDCAGFGPPFTCDAKSRMGASGDALVCRRP